MKPLSDDIKLIVWWCFYCNMGAIYGSNCVWKFSDGMKPQFDFGFLRMSVRELDVVWAREISASNTASMALLIDGWEMLNMSPNSCWNVPVAKNLRWTEVGHAQEWISSGYLHKTFLCKLSQVSWLPDTLVLSRLRRLLTHLLSELGLLSWPQPWFPGFCFLAVLLSSFASSHIITTSHPPVVNLLISLGWNSLVSCSTITRLFSLLNW